MSVPFDADVPIAVWMIVKGFVIVALAAGAHLVMRRRASAATRHLMWRCALAGLLMLPVLSSVLPAWQLAIRPATPSASAAVWMAAAADRDLGARSVAVSTIVLSTPVVPMAMRIPWAEVLLSVYAAGVLLFLARLAVERVTVQRLTEHATVVQDPDWRRLFVECARRMRLRQPVRLLRSREHTMPMAFGTRVPAILLPAIADTWTEDRRRAVLLHELAHVARRDCLTQTVAAVVCALYWIHPGVWLVARRLRIEGELACDDLVLASGTPARDYAGHLLELAYALGGRRAPALVVSMARPRQLEGRMLAILDAARNRTIPRLGSRLASVAITAALLVPLAGVQMTALSVTPHEQPADALAVGSDAPATANDGAYTAAAPLKASRQASKPAADTTAAQDRLPGTWQIRPTTEPGFVHLTMMEGDSNWGSTVPLALLEGLSQAQLSGSGTIGFRIRRDAGTFTFDGMLRQGVGIGTYSFSPNEAFPGELVKRGLARPTARDQYELARSDIGLAFVDELSKQSYTRPEVADLVRAGHHGVHLDFLRGMGELGYRLGLLSALIEQRDHGVTPQYVRELGAQGYTHLSPDEVRRARDHGVSTDYVREMRALYPSVSLDQLVTARDHGINPQFIRELGELDHTTLSLEAATTARDHGMSPGYARELKELGYRASLAELTKARDHGVSVEFVRELAALGYRDLTLDKVIQVRDHGVTPGYVRQLRELGYDRLDLDEIVSLRDHGVTPDRIRRANARAGSRLPLDMIKALASGGMK